jgi:hypothetical protein
MRPSTAQDSFGGLRSCSRDPTAHAGIILGEDHCEQHARDDKNAGVSTRADYTSINVTSIPLPYRYTRGESRFSAASHDQNQVGADASTRF